MRHGQSPDFDGEYGAVRLPELWHVLSLLCFAGALGARYLVTLLPDGWQPPFHRSLLPGMVAVGLACLGLVLGLIGMRVQEGRSTARVAVFLNATVLALSLLALFAFLYIVRG